MALKTENGNQEPRNVDILWKAENVRNRFSPVASKKKHSPAITVILAQWDLCYSSDLQNGKRVNSCCLSFCLWPFVRQQQKTHTLILALRT